MWEDIKSWAAISPIASGLRTAFALGLVSGLNFISEQYLSWGLPLWAQFAVASALPPVLRALNDKDGVFGNGTAVIEEATEEAAA